MRLGVRVGGIKVGGPGWQVIVREKEVSMATQGATTVKGLVTLNTQGNTYQPKQDGEGGEIKY